MRSHRPSILLFCMWFVWLLPARAHGQDKVSPEKPLTNQDVVDLLKVGLTSDIVVTKIKSSTCNFDTSPDALKRLKASNVPDAVILAMVQAPVAPKEAVDVEKTGNRERAEHSPSHVDWSKATSVRPKSNSSNQSNNLQIPPQNTVRAIAYRVIPQQRTTYYQSGSNSSSTSCYGQGQFYSFGDYGNMNMNMNCDTTYTTPTKIPITWQFADVYIVVEAPDQLYLIGCRANWRWSSCTPLIVGEVFPVEISGGTMKVTGSKNGKKEVHVKYNILQVSPKS